MGEYLYLIGIALVLFALALGRRRRATVSARNITNSIVINGDATGPVSQTHIAPSPPPPAVPAPDRVAWAIGSV
ncbi:hypothetical protein ACKI1O_48375, partial [Streptomyces scabiei]